MCGGKDNEKPCYLLPLNAEKQPKIICGLRFGFLEHMG
jgi:hypothetical protein